MLAPGSVCKKDLIISCLFVYRFVVSSCIIYGLIVLSFSCIIVLLYIVHVLYMSCLVVYRLYFYFRVPFCHFSCNVCILSCIVLMFIVFSSGVYRSVVLLFCRAIVLTCNVYSFVVHRILV